MSTATAKRKPLTAGTVKGAGVRPGRRISTNHRSHNTTKKQIRQIVRAIRRVFNRIRPVLAGLCFLFLLGIVGGMERDTIGFGKGTWMSVKAMILWVWLMRPYLTIGNGGRR